MSKGATLDHFPTIADYQAGLLQPAQHVGSRSLTQSQLKAIRKLRRNGHALFMGAAADAWKAYDVFRERMADGSYDLDDDTFKLALFLSTSDAATLTSANAVLADLTNQHANANGYTTGGITLTTTWVAATSTLTFDYTNSPVWTASGGSIVARFGVLYDSTFVTDGLVCMTLLDNAPADVTATTGNTLTVDANASGVFTLTGMT